MLLAKTVSTPMTQWTLLFRYELSRVLLRSSALQAALSHFISPPISAHSLLHTFPNTAYIIHSFNSPFILHLPGCFSSLCLDSPPELPGGYIPPPHLSEVHLLTKPSLKQLCSLPAHLTAQLETTLLGLSPARCSDPTDGES